MLGKQHPATWLPLVGENVQTVVRHTLLTELKAVGLHSHHYNILKNQRFRITDISQNHAVALATAVAAALFHHCPASKACMQGESQPSTSIGKYSN